MIFEDKPLSPEVYLPLVEGILHSPYHHANRILLPAKEEAFVLDTVDEKYLQDIVEYYPQLQKVQDFSTVSTDIIKLVATFSEEELDHANSWLNVTFDGISSVTTGFDSVDIILSDINKAVALAHLCDYFGLTSQDVTAFGDNQNDREMLEFAGKAIATANARTVIKEIADDVIGDCDEDAVLNYLQTCLK